MNEIHIIFVAVLAALEGAVECSHLRLSLMDFDFPSLLVELLHAALIGQVLCSIRGTVEMIPC